MDNKGGAPEGIRHGKSYATFDQVEHIRDEYEYNGKMPSQIAREYGYPLNTVKDWCYFRTRLLA